jgi:HSP20 family molecular chaperone IbpA
MKYTTTVVKDDLYGLFEKGMDMVSNYWNVLDHPDFPFVTLTSTTNGYRNFPPYNIIESKDGKVRLEMAVAGFTKDRLKVELEGNILIIQGVPAAEPNNGDTIRQKGISNASFVRTFEMAVNTLIENVELKDGLLTVHVSSKQPETKPRTAFEIK